MSNLIPFQFETHSVQVITDDDGEFHFIAKEVAEILGYSDAFKMCERLDDDEKSNRQIRGLGSPTGGRGIIVINESGLYSAILGSNKPEAKPFRRWVTSEVLPSIRKTGAYVAPDKDFALLLLRDWKQRHDATEGLMRSISASIGLVPEGPLTEMVWSLFDSYTTALSLLLGDSQQLDDGLGWMAWFYLENDMGRKGMHAGYDGQLAPIKTLEQLHELIAEGHKRGEVQP